MSKLFISHAAHDKGLVEAFVDLLEGGVGVPHASIFCSSLKGQSIKPGAAFVESIRQNLDEATCVVALISEAFHASAFCMCELGGVWLVSKDFLPIVVPPLDFSALKAVTAGIQGSQLARADDLDEIRDELGTRLGIKVHNTARWNTKRDKFLVGLPKLLVKFEGPVLRVTHTKLKKELEDYKTECQRLEQELQTQKALVTQLKKTKDAQAVAKVVRENSTTADAFQELATAAAKALRPLSSVVREAFFQNYQGRDYSPRNREDWDEIQTEVEHGYLVLNDSENGASPDDRNKKVRLAKAALRDLSRWLDEPPADFAEWYDDEFDGERGDMTLRPFWELHLLP